MDEPQKKLDIDLGQVDAINNLDTARMTLRWALERIHGVEKEKNEAAKALEKSLRDILDLQRSLAMRADESQQRELYYAKMEELISLHLAGKLNVEALVRQQAETSQLQQFLLEKQAQVDRDLQTRSEKLELEYKRIVEDHEARARAQALAAETAQKQLRVTLEKEHASRLVALHEAEVRIKQQERILAERQVHFEEFHRTQRAQLEHDIKLFSQEREDQVRFRVEGAERVLGEKLAAAESAWAREKTLLLQDLNQWRQTAQEQIPRILELESKLARVSEEAQRLASELARESDSRAKLHARAEAADASHRAALIDLEARQRDKEAELLRRDRDLENRREQIVGEQQARVQELEKRLADAEDKARRAADALSLELDRAKAQDAAGAALASRYESRLAELEAAKRDREAHLLGAIEESERHRERVSGEEQARVVDLEKRLADAEEQARRAQETLSIQEGRGKTLEETIRQLEGSSRTDAAQAEAKSKEKEASLLSRIAELERRRDQFAQETQVRLLDLEGRLIEAEEQARRAQEALSVQEGRGKTLEETIRLLEGSSRTDAAEVERRRDQFTQETQARLRGLEARLVEAEEKARRASEALSREEERRKNLESTKSGLEKRLSEIVLLEKRLAVAEEGGEAASAALAYESELRRTLEKKLSDQEKLLIQWQDKASAGLVSKEEAARVKALAESREAAYSQRLEELSRKERELDAKNIALEEERLGLAADRARTEEERKRLADHELKLDASQQARLRDQEARHMEKEAALLRRIQELEGRRGQISASQQDLVLDLEKRLAGAEESARQAVAALALEQERRKKLEDRERAAAAEHLARLAELEARQRDKEASLWGRVEQVDRRREEILEIQQTQLLELEKKLAGVEEENQRLALDLARAQESRKKLEDRRTSAQTHFDVELEEVKAEHARAEKELRLRVEDLESQHLLQARKLEEEAAAAKAQADAREAEARSRLEEVGRTEQELAALAQSLESMAEGLDAEKEEFSAMIAELEGKVQAEDEGPTP